MGMYLLWTAQCLIKRVAQARERRPLNDHHKAITSRTAVRPEGFRQFFAWPVSQHIPIRRAGTPILTLHQCERAARIIEVQACPSLRWQIGTERGGAVALH